MFKKISHLIYYQRFCEASFGKSLILSLISNKLFDSIIIELLLNNKKFIFSSIYRTPNIDNVSFTMFFNLLFPTLFKYVDKKIIICGDFNIDLKKCNICKNAEIFLEKCHELGCSPLINRPTRIDLNKNYFTIIDNFLQIFIVQNVLALLYLIYQIIFQLYYH